MRVDLVFLTVLVCFIAAGAGTSLAQAPDPLRFEVDCDAGDDLIETAELGLRLARARDVCFFNGAISLALPLPQPLCAGYSPDEPPLLVEIIVEGTCATPQGVPRGRLRLRPGDRLRLTGAGDGASILRTSLVSGASSLRVENLLFDECSQCIVFSSGRLDGTDLRFGPDAGGINLSGAIDLERLVFEGSGMPVRIENAHGRLVDVTAQSASMSSPGGISIEVSNSEFDSLELAGRVLLIESQVSENIDLAPHSLLALVRSDVGGTIRTTRFGDVIAAGSSLDTVELDTFSRARINVNSTIGTLTCGETSDAECDETSMIGSSNCASCEAP